VPGTAGGGIAPGTWNCHGLDATGVFAVLRRVIIQDASHYVYYTRNDKEKLPGTYRLDSAAGKVTWLSGPLVGRRGDFERDARTKSDVLIVLEGTVPTAFRCYLSGG
jgi:hypothetical protein